MATVTELPVLNNNGVLINLESTTHSGRQRGGWITFPFFIASMAGLTLAASGCSANLIVYLIQQFNIKSVDAAQIFNIVNGCTSLTTIIGAIIADSFMGTFSVISISSFASLLGTILFLLTVTVDSLRPAHCVINNNGSCKAPTRIQLTVLYTAIALAPVGVAATRSTMASMGAAQFGSEKDQRVFFNWSVITTYMVSAIGLIAIVYIEDNVGWSWGFGVSVVANAIGFAIFLVGNKYYKHVKPQGSPFTSMARVVVAAIRKKSEHVSSENSVYCYDPISAATNSSSSPSSSFRCLNRAAPKTQEDTHQDGSITNPWRLCTVQEVENLKILIRIFPLWAANIFISISIAIQNSLVVLQALTMDRHMGPHFKVPSGSFLVFSISVTAIFLSIFDHFLLPLAQKITNTTPTPLQIVGIGHVLNFIGMAMSALVESRRLHVVQSNHNINDQSASSPIIVPMSAMWLVVPLAIIGVGEAFHLPGQLIFYYQEFPKPLRSTSTAMGTLIAGIGYYLSTVMVNLVRKATDWLPDDINSGRLDNVYWLLTVVCVINFVCYLTCAIMYKYQNEEKSEANSNSVSEIKSVIN